MPENIGPARALPFLANEEIIFQIRQSVVLLILQFIVLAVLAIGLALILRSIGGESSQWLAIAAIIGPTFVALVRLLDYLSTTYTLTNRRVQTDFGIFRRTSYAIPLVQVETLDLRRSLIGRIFGYGDVVCRPTAAVKLIISFNAIANPTLRREQIEEQLP